jgi:signal transduction histidine kinase
MRRSLAIRALIVSTLIVLVFTIPLAIVLNRLARDRALTLAKSDALALAPIVSVSGDPRVAGAVARVAQQAGPREVSLVFPDGSILGSDRPLEVDSLSNPALLSQAREGESFVVDVPGGAVRYEPVNRNNGTVAVVRVFVPNREIRRNLRRDIGVLIVLGLALVGLAVFVSDRLGRSVVRSVGRLEDTARALANGRLDARIEPSGPPEVVQVGGALNLLGSRIDELLRLERERIADLSHRLRTPVTALRAEVALVNDQEVRPRIERGIEEITKTIDQIIRDAQGPIRSGLGIIADLGKIAKDRALFWAVLAEDQKRLFMIDIEPGPHPVAVEESDLAAVVDALLDNVFSHTPEGSDFRIRVRTIGNEVELVVDDHGAGVPDQFDPERGSSGVGSTGLGLDIVRKTVAGCGGTVALRNRARGGARVRATFPLMSGNVTMEPVIR